MNSAIRYLVHGLTIVGLLFTYGYLHSLYVRKTRSEQEVKDMFWQFAGVVMMIAGLVFLLWLAFILFFVVSGFIFGLAPKTRSVP